MSNTGGRSKNSNEERQAETGIPLAVGMRLKRTKASQEDRDRLDAALALASFSSCSQSTSEVDKGGGGQLQIKETSSLPDMSRIANFHKDAVNDKVNVASLGAVSFNQAVESVIAKGAGVKTTQEKDATKGSNPLKRPRKSRTGLPATLSVSKREVPLTVSSLGSDSMGLKNNTQLKIPEKHDWNVVNMDVAAGRQSNSIHQMLYDRGFVDAQLKSLHSRGAMSLPSSPLRTSALSPYSASSVSYPPAQDEPLDLKVRKYPDDGGGGSNGSSSSNNTLLKGNPQVAEVSSTIRSTRTHTKVGLLELSSLPPGMGVGFHSGGKTKIDDGKHLPPKKRRLYTEEESYTQGIARRRRSTGTPEPINVPNIFTYQSLPPGVHIEGNNTAAKATSNITAPKSVSDNTAATSLSYSTAGRTVYNSTQAKAVSATKTVSAAKTVANNTPAKTVSNSTPAKTVFNNTPAKSVSYGTSSRPSFMPNTIIVSPVSPVNHNDEDLVPIVTIEFQDKQSNNPVMHDKKIKDGSHKKTEKSQKKADPRPSSAINSSSSLLAKSNTNSVSSATATTVVSVATRIVNIDSTVTTSGTRLSLLSAASLPTKLTPGGSTSSSLLSTNLTPGGSTSSSLLSTNLTPGGSTPTTSSAASHMSSVFMQHSAMALQPDEDGDLPLHIAVVQNETSVVDRLISFMIVSKAGLDHQNNLRQTPLHLAVIVEQALIVQQLLQGGANPNLTDRRGMTCVQLSVQRRNLKILRLLLEQSVMDPDLNNKNYEGMTVLHMAVIMGHADIVTLLLENGADIDVQDGKSGRTAVFHAAENNHYRIASILLQRAANVNIPSYSGSTPAQAANGRGKSEMVGLLIKYGAETARESASDAASHARSQAQLLHAARETSGGRAGKRGGGGGGAAGRGGAKQTTVKQMLRDNLRGRASETAMDQSEAPTPMSQSQARIQQRRSAMMTNGTQGPVSARNTSPVVSSNGIPSSMHQNASS